MCQENPGSDVRIAFQNIPWEEPATGVKQKIVKRGNQQLRLLRFEDDFIELEWCTKGYIGYVLDGKMTVDFNGAIQHFKKGDGLWIEQGEASKHKVSIAKGEFVELILFEEVG